MYFSFLTHEVAPVMPILSGLPVCASGKLLVSIQLSLLSSLSHPNSFPEKSHRDVQEQHIIQRELIALYSHCGLAIAHLGVPSSRQREGPLFEAVQARGPKYPSC